jgi:hypothetical protein
MLLDAFYYPTQRQFSDTSRLLGLVLGYPVAVGFVMADIVTTVLMQTVVDFNRSRATDVSQTMCGMVEEGVYRLANVASISDCARTPTSRPSCILLQQ